MRGQILDLMDKLKSEQQDNPSMGYDAGYSDAIEDVIKELTVIAGE